MGRSFPSFLSRINEARATIKISSSSEQVAEEISLQWDDIATYVLQEQALNREERVAWRDTQKMQAQVDVEQKQKRKRQQTRYRLKIKEDR